MDKVRKPWLRGAVSLAVLAGLAAALIASPATAHFLHPSKAQVKKVAKRVFNQRFPGAFNAAIAPLEANNQDKCADGAVLAYAFVDGNGAVTSNAAFSTNGVGPQFNCKGGPVEVRFDSVGTYEVRIPGITTVNPTTGVYLFQSADDHNDGIVNIDTHSGDDYIEVDTWSADDATSDNADFYLIALRAGS